MKVSMRFSMICAAIVCLGVAASPSNASNASYVASKDAIVVGGTELQALTRSMDDYRSIYLQPTSGSGRALIRRFEGGVAKVEVSTDGSLLAILEITGSATGSVSSRLVVLRIDGTIIHTIPNIYRFAWAPEGHNLVCISGTYREEGSGFAPTGAFVFDADTRKQVSVDILASDVYWAEWDNNIYLNVEGFGASSRVKVVRLNPRTLQLTPTDHRGIYFSPDGKYYYRGGGDGDIGGEVFATQTNARVPIDRAFETEHGRREGPVVGWIGDSTLVFHSPLPSEAGTDYVFDPKSGTRRHAAGRVVGMGRQSERSVVLGTLNASIQSISSLAER